MNTFRNEFTIYSCFSKKYGVSLDSYTIRKDIREKADLSKVKIVSKAEMPYLKYINYELADYIDINKRDIEQLIKYFKNISNEDFWHTHRLYRTEDGIETSLFIKDLKTGNISRLRAFVYFFIMMYFYQLLTKFFFEKFCMSSLCPYLT